MAFITSLQAAEKWQLTKRQVNSLCKAGRISGAVLENGRWRIPEDYVYYGKRKKRTAGMITEPWGGYSERKSEKRSGKYINIGAEGFRSIRNGLYIDKTGLIAFVNRCLDTSQKLLCVSRPRRFGKSFATKMLCAYYSRGCDASGLFADLAIAQHATYKQYMNRYDVLYLDMTFFLSVLNDKQQFLQSMERDILGDLGNYYGLQLTECSLVEGLSKVQEQIDRKFILIIDEWDAPFRERKNEKLFLAEYILWLRSLFKSSFTDRLFAGVYMTGILPIKKYGHESAVSDFYEYSMIEPSPLQSYIGFTDEEVQWICENNGMDYEQMKSWYDGYSVGNVRVFNPKSVMEAILRHKYSSYWTKTETYESLRDYIDLNFDGLKDSVIDMLGGVALEVDTGSFQNDITSLQGKDDVLTLLIHLGYLAYEEDTGRVRIPNEEVRSEFLRAIKNGKRYELMQAILQSDTLLQATWQKDGEMVAAILGELHQNEIAPQFYNNEQALRSVVKLGYLCGVDHYVKIEELPSGKGYADIVFLPRQGSSKPALLVELKWDKSCYEGLRQIKEKRYAQILRNYTGEVFLVGINYDKKSKRHTCRIESYVFDK